MYVPTLGDLLSTDVWERFEGILLETLEDVVIVEVVSMEALSKKDQELVSLFMGDGWQSLNRNVLYKKKKQFAELARRTGANSIKEEIRRLVSEKCHELRDMPSEAGDKINVFSMAGNVSKVNGSDKPPEIIVMKQATKSTFSKQGQTGHFGDKINIKIKGDSVANDTPETPPPEITGKLSQCNAKLSDMPVSEIKPRGKPPDVREYNTG